MSHLFFLYEDKSNVHHLIEVSLKIFTNKLPEFSQTTIKFPDPTLLQKMCAEQYEIRRACL
jgi:hypothetical protein